MNTTPSTPSAPTDMFVRTLLDTTADVERAETAIKAEILRAARAGDSERVVAVVTRWNSLPVSEVLSPSPPKPA